MLNLPDEMEITGTDFDAVDRAESFRTWSEAAGAGARTVARGLGSVLESGMLGDYAAGAGKIIGRLVPRRDGPGRNATTTPSFDGPSDSPRLPEATRKQVVIGSEK
jgi:hypothetical protein